MLLVLWEMQTNLSRIWTRATLSIPNDINHYTKNDVIFASTPRYRGERYFFHCIAPFTLHPYFIILSIKQGGIKYNFFEFLV